MSKQQQLQLDAILRQGQFDPGADVPTSRAAFSALMSQVPVPDDVQQKPTTTGGVGGIEVTIRGSIQRASSFTFTAASMSSARRQPPYR
jgi:hypothetical protein